MTDLHVVKLTPDFEHNLDDIELFLRGNDAPAAFDELLEELTGSVVPNLEQFPGMGRSFLGRPARSVETTQAGSRLTAQLDDLDHAAELREYVMPRYLILYAVIKGTVYLLSIRHHLQLSFDLLSHWSPV